MTTFIRVFDVETKAVEFASAHGGKVVVHYDVDALTGQMVKEFVVKFFI